MWMLTPLFLFACGSASEPAAPTAEVVAQAPIATPKPEAAPSAPEAGLDQVPARLPLPGEGKAARPVGLINGDFAVDLTLPDLRTGESWTLSEHIGPEVVGLKSAIVSFSASWCGPCRASLPQLAELEKEHGDDLLVIIVTIDKTEAGRKREVMEVKQAGLRGPVLHADEAAQQAWLGGRRNIPHLYILNAIGEVLVQDRGYGSKVRSVLPRQVGYALSHPEYVERR